MDLDTQFLLFTGLQLGCILWATFWFWRRQDELPLVMSTFLFYVFSFRFFALIKGWSDPVDIRPFGFEPMSVELGLGSLGLVALGETALLATYMLTQKRRLQTGLITASPRFIQWLRPAAFIFAGVAILVSLQARRMTEAQVDAGRVMAFEVSAYLYELPLMLISVALLFAILWKCGGLPTLLQKLGALAIGGTVAWLTFGPTGRFQFLGWILAVTIILSAGDPIKRRLFKIGVGVAFAVALFSLAGVLRNADEDTDLSQSAWDRFFEAEDANMLDGLVLLQQVYPDRLPFSYGGEHLEIFERPIPRSLWPGKPVGGYMNRLGLTSVSTGFTLGISPGLFGSFYQEGGNIAVGILSVLYGFGLGRLVRFSAGLPPVTGVLIRAICCASIIPLLRGGDLPGIYAWIFMAFWPCLLVLFLWRRVLFARRKPILPSRRRAAPPVLATPNPLRPT